MIFISGHCLVGSVSSPTGSWKITGLPFTSGAGEKSYGTISLRPESFGATVVQPIFAYIPINNTQIIFEKLVTGAMTDLASEAIANSGFMLSGHYFQD